MEMREGRLRLRQLHEGHRHCGRDAAAFLVGKGEVCNLDRTRSVRCAFEAAGTHRASRCTMKAHQVLK